jgi:glycosyltransferase involved in cell wall biosynthesis
MKIIYLQNGMHIKNDFALKNYKNIDLHIINNSEILNSIELNNYDCVYSPNYPIDVSKYPNTKFLFGPHFSIFPEKNLLDIIRAKNTIYVQPSEWAADVWKNNVVCNNIKIKTMPFGVDTTKFNEINNIEERKKVFIYFKRRKPSELEFLLSFLKTQNLEVKLFDYCSKYSEEEYLYYLQNSKYGIWLDAHESQGFALEEALSCNVPLLVWNVTSMKQEYGSKYDDIPATTIPYWDERCGEYFYNFEELEDKYNLFISKLNTYKPREYILENLSMEICEKKFIELIKNI